MGTTNSDPKRSGWQWALPGRGMALRLGGTLLALALLWLLFRQQEQGWMELLQALGRLSWQSVMSVVCLMLGSRLAVSARWHVLLRSGGVAIPWMQTVRITFAGLFLSNFLPTTIGGDVARLAGALRLGYDRAVSLASLVVDRLVGMAGMGMAALELLLYLPLLQARLAVVSRSLPAFLSVALHPFVYSLSVIPFHKRLWQRGVHLTRRLWQALGLWLGWSPAEGSSPEQAQQGRRGLLAALAFTWVHMLCTFGILWVLLQNLGEALPFALVSGLWALSYFITLLPVSINGLGLQELSVTFLFTTLGGVSASAGLTLALFMRLLPMLASLPGALFLPGILAGDAVSRAQQEIDQPEP